MIMDITKLEGFIGTVFNDGPYEYEVMVKSGSILTDNSVVGISIAVLNTPAYIGGDLLVYMLGHLMDSGGEELRSSEAKFMIAKIILEEYSTLGDVAPLINITSNIKPKPLDELSKIILAEKTNLYNLEEISNKVESRMSKFKKTMDYITNTYEPVDDEFNPFKITYSVVPKIIKDKNTLYPGIAATVTLAMSIKYDNRGHYIVSPNLIKYQQHLMETIMDVLPLEINRTKDQIRVNVEKLKTTA
jgi:hypothetical protein